MHFVQFGRTTIPVSVSIMTMHTSEKSSCDSTNDFASLRSLTGTTPPVDCAVVLMGIDFCHSFHWFVQKLLVNRKVSAFELSFFLNLILWVHWQRCLHFLGYDLMCLLPACTSRIRDALGWRWMSGAWKQKNKVETIGALCEQWNTRTVMADVTLRSCNESVNNASKEGLLCTLRDVNIWTAFVTFKIKTWQCKETESDAVLRQ